jgi:hypothetical protein
MTPASCAEASSNGIAAITLAAVLGCAAHDFDTLAWEDRIRCAVSGNVLAISAPADSRDDGLRFDSEANLAAKATTTSFGHLAIRPFAQVSTVGDGGAA